MQLIIYFPTFYMLVHFTVVLILDIRISYFKINYRDYYVTKLARSYVDRLEVDRLFWMYKMFIRCTQQNQYNLQVE